MRLPLAVLISLVALPLIAAPSVVTISGHQLIVSKRLGNGSLGPAAPYVIRGVVWSPAGMTTVNSLSARRAELASWVGTDAPLMGAMNVNTVRLVMDPGFDAAGTAVLDQLYANGIMVIMTVDDAINDTARVSQAVNFYKDHPAVLMWMLGNEWNINRYYTTNPTISAAEAAQRTQTAAALIKSIDSGHPVVSSYGDIDINDTGMHLADTANYVNNVCTSVDIWALNIYRGNSFLNLFTQWESMTTKPMLLGEFGTDAFRSAGSATTYGTVDGVMQSDFDLALWDEIFLNLSANVPEAVCLGGTFFEFNDEWWKVQPSGTQQTGGYGGPHPDGFANEEYFGIVDIARQPRAVYTALTAAFSPSYSVPTTRRYRAVSRGYNAAEYPSENGTVWFFKDGAKLYSILGAGAAGSNGRGINVGLIDPDTESVTTQVFDTWGGAHLGTNDICNLNAFIDGMANGKLILFGVADDGGINQFDSCNVQSTTCTSGLLSRLTSLGSQEIGSYCYRHSWAMASVKGEGTARGEQRSANGEASAATTLPKVVRTLSVTFTGNGTVRTVPAGLNCTSNCNAPFPINSSVRLYPIGDTGWRFSSWSGDCGGSGACTVTMSAAMSVGAAFDLFPAPASIEAHYTGSAAAIAWNAVSGATAYNVVRSSDGINFTTIASPGTTSYNDSGVSSGQAYLYRVRAVSAQGSVSDWSAIELMTAVAFTDDPLVIQSTKVKAAHLTQLRTAVNAVRALAALGGASFTDASPTVIRAMHITELRSALSSALSTLGLSSVTFSRTLTAQVSVISAVDFSELREGVR